MKPANELEPGLLAQLHVKTNDSQLPEWHDCETSDGRHCFIQLFAISALCKSQPQLSHFRNTIFSLAEDHAIPKLSQSTRIRLSALLQPILDADFSSSDLTTFYDITRSLSFREQNKQYLSDLSDIFGKLGLLQVTRERQSITQGTAAVSCNGHPLVRYGDDIYLKQEDGSFTNGHRKADDISHTLQHYGIKPCA